MQRLYTDFDGPIIDVSERYYRVYHYCLVEASHAHQALNPLSKTHFWALKRARVPEKEIGLKSGLTPEQAGQFAQLRRQTVHTLPYFEYDALIPGAIAALERFVAQGIELVLVTMRRHEELAYALERFNLERFFPPAHRYCLPDDYAKTQDIEDKPYLLGKALAELPPATPAWMVGDTEADIVAAQRHHMPVMAVLSGIRDRQQLSLYHPDRIVPDLHSIATELVCSPT